MSARVSEHYENLPLGRGESTYTVYFHYGPETEEVDVIATDAPAARRAALGWATANLRSGWKQVSVSPPRVGLLF